MPYDTTILKKPTKNKFQTISCTLGIKGPRYNGRVDTVQHIDFEINTIALLIYEPERFKRAPVYSDAPEYVALVMEKEEIFAEKIRALMTKRRKHRERDMYDIAFLIRKGIPINKNAILKKLKESEINPKIADLIQSIESIKSNWKYLTPLVNTPLEPYEEIKKLIINNDDLEKILK